jgi:hypothetical protein
VIRRRRDGVTVSTRDPVIESPGGSAMVTPNRAVIRRSGHSVI